MAGKTLTIYGPLHPKSDIDRLYLKRKRVKKKVVKKVAIVKTENIMEKEDFKNNNQIELKIYGTKIECMDSLLVKCLKK